MAKFGASDDIDDIAEDLEVSGGRRNARNKGGRGGKGGGGKGGGQGDMNREVAISKALSKLLRHAAIDAGLNLDSEGYARLDQVMNWQRLKSLKVTFNDIRTATTENAKQRFSMKLNPALDPQPDATSEQPSDWVIRANQGHSIAIDSAALLVPVSFEAGNVPEIVLHGTYFAFYKAIVESGGLKKMGRNHIHCSTGLPEGKQGVISGMRNDAELLIYIDIKKSLEDGVLWWVSENGVILTEGDDTGVLSTKHWSKVVGRKQDVGELWEDGEEVGELPERLRRSKVPIGKGPRAVRGSDNVRTQRSSKGDQKEIKAQDAQKITKDLDGLTL